MSDVTKIEWAERTWSPWIGCTKVSEGCKFCDAEVSTPTRVMRHRGEETWGPGKPRHVRKDWEIPLRWQREAAARGQPCRVFPSLCDWLDPEAPLPAFVAFLELIAATPNLQWLLLTKRPEHWQKRMRDAGLYADCNGQELAAQLVCEWTSRRPPANVWCGISAENQARYDRRWADQSIIPTVCRWVSYEPALGPVKFHLCTSGFMHVDDLETLTGKLPPQSWLELPEWIVVGGESGPDARPCDYQWLRDAVGECQTNAVPVFVKQIGARPGKPDPDVPGSLNFWPDTTVRHPKGGDMAEWPEDLRVRQFPAGTYAVALAEAQ